MGGFTAERGEVLLSIQIALTREEERGLSAGPPRGETTVERAYPGARPHPGPHAPRRAGPAQPAPPSASPAPAHRAVAPPAGSRRVEPPPPSGVLMVDPATGAGSAAALRRDLTLERAWPRKGRPEVIVLGVLGLADVRAAGGEGEEVIDRVLRTLVEVAPFVTEPGDRLYRAGRDELAVLTTGAADRVGALRLELERAAGRLLAERGLPPVRLSARLA